MIAVLVMLYMANGVVAAEFWRVPGGIERCWEVLPTVAKTGIGIPEWATFTCVELQREPGLGHA